MNDRSRIRAWYFKLTQRGGEEATRVVRYIERRERAAWHKGYREGFEAGGDTARCARHAVELRLAQALRAIRDTTTGYASNVARRALDETETADPID